MNESEKVAFKYLCEQGYLETDIKFQSRSSPDFITLDNKKWEVKRVFHNSIFFTYSQKYEFPKHDINVIITTKKEIVCVIPYSEISTIITENGTAHLNEKFFCVLDEMDLLFNKIRCDWLKYQEEHKEELEEMAMEWDKDRQYTAHVPMR